MARILASVRPPEGELVLEVLAEEGYEPIRVDPDQAAAGSTDALFEALTSQAPEVAVLDYQAEDALSVKLMQRVRHDLPLLKFIFILREDPGLEHLVMVMNEGAYALIAVPPPQGALRNFIKRALAAHARDKDHEEEVERCRRLIEEEKNCSLGQAVELAEVNRSLKQSRRLINFLLQGRGASTRSRTLLLVSDSAYQIDLFKKHLTEVGFAVHSAPDGAQGLEAAREHNPRIIVSDLEMPGLNGLELCREIKNDDSLGPNHFIICTANESRIESVMAPENKVDDCLLKPGRREDFQDFTARVALGLLA